LAQTARRGLSFTVTPSFSERQIAAQDVGERRQQPRMQSATESPDTLAIAWPRALSAGSPPSDGSARVADRVAQSAFVSTPPRARATR
jgi:hypothetical protein